MNINKLSFKVNTENGLSIELFIDEKSIDNIFNSGNPYLPYWDFDDDLPYNPPNKRYVSDFSKRIIGVCDCGEYGCGSTSCQIREVNKIVTWYNFKVDLLNVEKVFNFNELDYKETVNNILKIVNDYKKQNTRKNSI